MIEVKFYDGENKGFIVCEELEEHGGKLLCCHTEQISGKVKVLQTLDQWHEKHVIVPTSHLSSVISIEGH